MVGGACRGRVERVLEQVCVVCRLFLPTIFVAANGQLTHLATLVAKAVPPFTVSLLTVCVSFSLCLVRLQMRPELLWISIPTCHRPCLLLCFTAQPDAQLFQAAMGLVVWWVPNLTASFLELVALCKVPRLSLKGTERSLPLVLRALH